MKIYERRKDKPDVYRELNNNDAIKMSEKSRSFFTLSVFFGFLQTTIVLKREKGLTLRKCGYISNSAHKDKKIYQKKIHIL